MSTIIDTKEIAARTQLASLSMGMFRAVLLHKGETRAENERHNTNSAKVLVRITNHPALKELASLHAQARIEHNRLTMPTPYDGVRLIPVGRELEHSVAMRKFGDEHNRIVAKFLADYPNEVATAKARLNGLYEESKWKSPSEIAETFRFETRYLPTPTEGMWGEWLEESARAAENEMRDRVKKALERVRDRCKSDGKLFASVFDSIRELTDLVPDMDFTGGLAPVIQAMEPLTKLHAEFVRDDEDLRKAAAVKAESILGALGGIGEL
jgi:hypothetical protein